MEEKLTVETNDEKALKKAQGEFAVAYKELRNKNYKKAVELFRKIEEKYSNSDDYKVGDVCNRTRAFIRIAEARLEPVKVEPESPEEILLEVVYHINSENPVLAAEYLTKIDGGYSDKGYLYYLHSLVHNLKEEKEDTFAYLKKSVEADEFYKIVAYNDPDYAHLLEEEEFLEIVQ